MLLISKLGENANVFTMFSQMFSVFFRNFVFSSNEVNVSVMKNCTSAPCSM